MTVRKGYQAALDRAGRAEGDAPAQGGCAVAAQVMVAANAFWMGPK